MSLVSIDSLQMVADSIRQVAVADSLHRVYIADSIASARLAAKTKIFGEESELCGKMMTIAEDLDPSIGSLTENPAYIILAVAFSLLYLVWLPHIIRGGNIRWSQLRSHRHKDNSTREVVGKQRFGISIATWSLGITVISMLTIRLVAQFSVQPINFDGVAWIIGGMGSVVAIALYGWGVLKAAGYLTLNMEFVGKILSMKRQLLIFCVILSSPLFVISGLTNYEQGEWVLQLPVFMGVIFAVIFIRQSFLLFMRQSISILHWFLYLCAVEILPLTFIWAVVTKYVIT